MLFLVCYAVVIFFFFTGWCMNTKWDRVKVAEWQNARHSNLSQNAWELTVWLNLSVSNSHNETICSFFTVLLFLFSSFYSCKIDPHIPSTRTPAPSSHSILIRRFYVSVSVGCILYGMFSSSFTYSEMCFGSLSIIPTEIFHTIRTRLRWTKSTIPIWTKSRPSNQFDSK